jgi:enterochelin esterase-like enzyme
VVHVNFYRDININMQILSWTVSAALLSTTALARPAHHHWPNLNVHISVAEGILNGSTNGHVQLMFAPVGSDPLDDTDVTSSPNYFFGQNVYDLSTKRSVTLSGGSGDNIDFGVYGFPNVSVEDVEPGNYSVQAFLNVYETVTRADGSRVRLHFPCGDGAPGVGGYGTPITSIVNVTVTGDTQTIKLVFNNVTAPEEFTGKEIGGCQQGNYEDTEYLKYVKIRSDVLSAWWGRDVYVGANVLLPYGYNANNTKKRYPVVYAQGHWPGDRGAFNYPTYLGGAFASAWDNGTIPATNETSARETPKMILVTFRHENALYDDSYAVNTANLGPWGDAINEELIPHLDVTFNTIPEAYARIQQGGSTGGWESAASIIFRPDLFGVAFSSYPDSLDFHRHQDIPLYTNKNAYVRDDGSAINSIRTFENGTEIALASVAQENHWELTYGTNSRSIGGQWDVWNAVFGVQGLNGYPLVPWDKVTGEIYPGAVEYWKHMDLANYITTNWDNEMNLGEVLKDRIFIYVGLEDDYFLNEGVAQFQGRVEEKGGVGWANFTYLAGEGHGGIYNLMDVWDYLELLDTWVKDHAPDGKTPLSPSLTASTARGNKFEDVMAYGGHKAALARQAPPKIEGLVATAGKWDPGMSLEAQWIVNGRPCGKPFGVQQGSKIKYKGGRTGKLQIAVTGTKPGYVKETRKSNKVTCT